MELHGVYEDLRELKGRWGRYASRLVEAEAVCKQMGWTFGLGYCDLVYYSCGRRIGL